MNSFTEFMNKAKEFPTQPMPGSITTLSAIQSSLTVSVIGVLTPFSFSNDEREKFSKEVSSLVQNEAFLSELGTQVQEPLEHESEDEFVKRASGTLRQILRDKFGLKN
jgi:Asp-tRNA(Asn)/Glu-tRNA(Gln) amidotransferase C subunit